MPQTDDNLDIENLDPAEPENFRRLREYAQRADQRAARAAELERENAFLRAGVDTSSRLGQAWASTYSGKLDDIEAIRADAQDFDPRILVVNQANGGDAGNAAGDGTTQGTGDGGQQANASTGTAERTALADAAGAGGQVADPRRDSLSRAQQLLKEGRTFEDAAGELVAMRARAIHDGTMPALDALGRPYAPNGARG